MPKFTISNFTLPIFLLLTACSQSTQPEPKITTNSIPHAITCKTPTPGWTLTPQSAYHVGDEVWCIHKLTPPEGMVAQVISEIKTAVTLKHTAATEKLPLKHYILGKTWKWPNQEPNLIFIDSLENIQGPLESAIPIELASPKNP